MAIIVASVSIDPLLVRAVQNVLVPLVGFHDGSPDDGGESDKQNRFDDHLFNTFRPSIEDRPPQWSIKSGPQPEADTIIGRCDIFVASAHRQEQIERCHAACRRWRHERGPARSALQVIFPFEPRSDLLDHFATIGVVY
jgi:hypothetical protein